MKKTIAIIKMWICLKLMKLCYKSSCRAGWSDNIIQTYLDKPYNIMSTISNALRLHVFLYKNSVILVQP